LPEVTKPEMESAIRIMNAILLPQKEGWGEEQSARDDSPMHHNNHVGGEPPQRSVSVEDVHIPFQRDSPFLSIIKFAEFPFDFVRGRVEKTLSWIVFVI